MTVIRRGVYINICVLMNQSNKLKEIKHPKRPTITGDQEVIMAESGKELQDSSVDTNLNGAANGQFSGAKLTGSEQKKAAQDFVKQWEQRPGDEKQECQAFWTQLIGKVLGHDTSDEQEVRFEYRTADGGFIDVLCENARFLVEQKGSSHSLDEQESRRSALVTPLTQAFSYVRALPADLKPRWICTCNFREFRIYNLNEDPLGNKPPALDFTLPELPDHLSELQEIFGEANSRLVVQQKLSLQASGLVANIHNELLDEYRELAASLNQPMEGMHHDIALLTVRLVFCLYAEDAGLFTTNQFTDWVRSYSADQLNEELGHLFAWLDEKPEDRDPFNTALNAFPYVDGGLFREKIHIPPLTEEAKQAIIDAGSFSWQNINPVIFGSLMEETLSHTERRQGGMHYTSVESIHRVIDPLFLNDLRDEFHIIAADSRLGTRARQTRLEKFRDKLASLQFLDPACGSGNFLTETFRCLRRLENDCLNLELQGRGVLDLGGDLRPFKVSISQFHGIEINDFACAVARTALWIAEQQALDDTEGLLGNSLPHLPLKDSGNILCANALRTDWNTVLPANRCSYVMGNPPFVGHRERKQNPTLPEDMKLIWGSATKDIDYSSCWYKKASEYLQNVFGARFAFVSTNSITQGIQPASIFPSIFANGWRIAFAHRTFAWSSQSSDEAHVHVVIIGMDRFTDKRESPILYKYQKITEKPVATYPKHINAYLLDAPDVFVTARSQKKGPLGSGLHLCNAGSMPIDNGNFLLNTPKEYDQAMDDPTAAKYVRPFRMGKELINGIDRWCLWLADAEPHDIRSSRFLQKRIDGVYKERAKSTRIQTRKIADQPWLFGENHQPSGDYLAIPVVFSGRRQFATCDYYSDNIIAGNKLYTCLDPDGFNFAIIESSMYMTWQKAIGGRLKSDCSFSNTLVWNTLPLPAISNQLHNDIAIAGKNILASRANHPSQSLADLYTPRLMPLDLRRAHENLDQLVDRAFGADHWLKDDNDARLSLLFSDYADLTAREKDRETK